MPNGWKAQVFKERSKDVLKDYIRPSKLIDDLFENTDMNSSTYRVARALLRVADSVSFDGNVPPVKISNGSLMAKAKIKSDNTLRSSTRWLANHGLIEIKKGSKARNAAATYTLHFGKPLTNGTAKNEVLTAEPNAVDSAELNAEVTASYTDRQDGLDRHVVVVSLINKGVREALEQNHFTATSELVDTTTNRLKNLVSDGITPDELTNLFNYVLKTAVDRFRMGNIKSPLAYALSTVEKTVREGTKSLNEFLDKQQMLQSPVIDATLPEIPTDVDIYSLDTSQFG